MQGWIKLHRKSMDSPVFKKDKLWRVWCYCLMKANHKKNEIMWNGELKLIDKGQFVFGRYECSQELHMKPSTLWRTMKFLQKIQNIDIQSNNRYSIITIVNWDVYQNRENENGQVNGQSDGHSNGQSDGHRQEYKNVKNDKNIYTPVIEEIISLWNKQNISNHCDMTNDVIIEINKCFKKWGIDKIKTAIVNYGKIINSPNEYYFNYRWTLKEFLNKNNGISQFIDDECFKKYRNNNGDRSGGISDFSDIRDDFS